MLTARNELYDKQMCIWCHDFELFGFSFFVLAELETPVVSDL